MVWKRWACSVRVCDGGVISRTEAASWNIWQLKLVLTLGHSVVNSLVTYGRDTVFYKWKGDFILELHISCEKEKKCMLCHCTLSLNWMFQTFCSLMDSKSSFRCSYQQRECGSQIKQAEASHLATGGGVKKKLTLLTQGKGIKQLLKERETDTQWGSLLSVHLCLWKTEQHRHSIKRRFSFLWLSIFECLILVDLLLTD